MDTPQERGPIDAGVTRRDDAGAEGSAGGSPFFLRFLLARAGFAASAGRSAVAVR